MSSVGFIVNMFWLSKHSSSSDEYLALNMDQENQPFLVGQKRQVFDYPGKSDLIVIINRDFSIFFISLWHLI